MNLPKHGLQTCVGIDLNGTMEPCAEPVDPASSFPFCPVHLHAIRTMPRRRTCAGATTYDHVMRPTRRECASPTANEETRLCPPCHAIERSEHQRADRAFQEECPTCGSKRPRLQAHVRVPPPYRNP